MTMSHNDPLTKMTRRERYDLGCDPDEMGGDVIFSGVPYLFTNGINEYHNNLCVVA